MATQQKYNESFLRELERLNPAQREAVDTIEGPVLVIAGPGTGKTHILAARIGRILLETDAQPHNILCLTFTDAGVQAMRQRLLSLIGPEAHRVHVFTFHSFCNGIIQSNLERFGRRDLEPLSDLERVEIVRRMLDELPHRHLLKQSRNDPHFYESHLQDLFQRMKSEAWTVEFVHKKIDEYLADLPQREEYVYKINRGDIRKGDLKTGQLEEEQLRMERLRAATALYPRYLQLMDQMRRYDYADMILWVLRAFDENPVLLRTYQEQYLYFLVDEFQDTNGAQNEVLRRLVQYWESPNVFIVGDDDQSIFEFQGARLQSLIEFHENYREGLKLVVLDHNYRSSQHILDSSSHLIGRNELRIVNSLQGLGIQKILTAKNGEFAKAKIRPAIVEYPDRLQEEVALVDQLEALRNSGFPMEEVAVIFAKHRQGQRLMELLDQRGIAYRTRRSLNVLDLPLIQNLRLLLEYFHTEQQRAFSGEHLLVQLMHLGCFGILPLELAKFSLALSGRSPKWRETLADADFLAKIVDAPTVFSGLSHFVETMLARYADCSVPAFIELAINRSGMLRWVLENEGPAGVQALFAFLEFAKKESARNPRLSLGRFLELLKNMDGNRIELAVVSPQSTANESRVTSHESRITNPQSPLNLLTAHASKGLEFQKVFLLDCTADNWEPSKRGSNYRFKFPDTLTLSGEEDAEEARRRLFYVAMTRAKETLQISYAAANEQGKSLERAIFVDEVLGAGLELEQRQAPAESVLAAQMALLLESRPVAPRLDSTAVQELLEGFSLSVSSMNKFLRCPLSFYYENVLQVPTLVSEAAWFGISMHNALCRGFQKMLASPKKTFPTAAGFAKLFEEELRTKQGFFGKKEFERRLALGKQYLQEYVQTYQPSWRKQVQVEEELKNVEVEGVPLKGVIDRIDLLGDLNVHLVDYKTGSQTSTKFAKPTEKNPHGGSYWRQLVFYKILFENWRNNTRRVTSTEISYLEPDAHGRFQRKSLSFRPDDVELVKNLIVDTYGKIMRQEFYEGCGESNCQWCNFLRNQGQVDSFSETDIEELDDF